MSIFNLLNHNLIINLNITVSSNENENAVCVTGLLNTLKYSIDIHAVEHSFWVLLTVCSPDSWSSGPRESRGEQSDSDLDRASQGSTHGLYHRVYHLFREQQRTPADL